MRRVVVAVAVVAAALIVIGIAVTGGSGAAQQSGIAYVRGTGQSTPEVWFAGAQGTGAHVIGPGTNPRLSPNGQLIAASSTSGQGQALTLYNTSGGVAGRFFNAIEQTAVAAGVVSRLAVPGGGTLEHRPGEQRRLGAGGDRHSLGVRTRCGLRHGVRRELCARRQQQNRLRPRRYRRALRPRQRPRDLARRLGR